MGNMESALQALNTDRPSLKRRFEEIDIDEMEAFEKSKDDIANGPRRRKLSSVDTGPQRELFPAGELSEVSITVLGKTWKLRGVDLTESEHLAGILNQRCRGSGPHDLFLSIDDQLVTRPALDVAFRLLSGQPISIEQSEVINVMAAAVWMKFERLIQACNRVMARSIRKSTVCQYHNVARKHNQDTLVQSCVAWLERNLMLQQCPDLLREVDPDLMREVINSPNFMTVHVEMDVYIMLRHWLFLQLNPDYSGSMDGIADASEDFFSNVCEQFFGRVDYLSTPAARVFAGAFRALRLSHIVKDLTSCRIIESDNVLPKDWLLPLYRRQWMQMLRLEQGFDSGPEPVVTEAAVEAFHGSAVRCGTIFQDRGPFCWRWTGYNQGTDIVMTFKDEKLILKRNVHTETPVGSVNMLPRRSLLYQLTVFTLDKDGRTTFEKKTDIEHATLRVDQERLVLTVPCNIQYPLYLNCRLLTFSPRIPRDKSRDHSHHCPEMECADSDHATPTDQARDRDSPEPER